MSECKLSGDVFGGDDEFWYLVVKYSITGLDIIRNAVVVIIVLEGIIKICIEHACPDDDRWCNTRSTNITTMQVTEYEDRQGWPQSWGEGKNEEPPLSSYPSNTPQTLTVC